MADDSSDQDDKTEAATPRRLEKAREDGQIARSRELSTFLLLLGGVGGLWAMGDVLYQQLGLVMEQSFLFERSQAFDTAVMLAHFTSMARYSLLTLLPLFVLLMLIALVAPMLLGGWLLSAKSLAPQISRHGFSTTLHSASPIPEWQGFPSQDAAFSTCRPASGHCEVHLR